MAFVGKVENPWSETKTKHVPELLVLKTEVIIIIFWICMFRQRMLADNSITSWDGQVSRNGSRMRTITSLNLLCLSLPKFSDFSWTKREGGFVCYIIFLSRAHSMPVPSRIMGLHIIHAIPGWSLSNLTRLRINYYFLMDLQQRHKIGMHFSLNNFEMVHASLC